LSHNSADDMHPSVGNTKKINNPISNCTCRIKYLILICFDCAEKQLHSEYNKVNRHGLINRKNPIRQQTGKTI
jgi:hypothetical protein